MNIRKLAANSFVQGGFLFTFVNLFIGFLSYLFNSLAAKILGPTGYSELAAYTAYSIVLSIPVLTITTDIIRRLGAMEKDQIKTVSRWESLIYSKTTKVILLTPLLFAIAFLFAKAANLHYFSALTLLLVSIMGIYWGFYAATFQALHWFGFYALVMLTITGLKLIGPIVSVPGLSRLDSILVIIFIANAITIAVGKYLLKNRSKTKPSKLKEIKKLRSLITNRVLIMTMLSLVAMNLLNNLDIMIARKILSAHESGLYAAWSLFAKIIFYITGPLTSLSLIFFSSHKFKEHHSKTMIVVVAALMSVGLVLFLMYSFLGHFLILLIFSKDYLTIMPYLPYAGIFGAVYSGIFFFNNYYLARASRKSLVGLAALPLYALALIFYGKTGIHIIQVNIIFSCSLFMFYIATILHYNMHRWNKRKTTTS